MVDLLEFFLAVLRQHKSVLALILILGILFTSFSRLIAAEPAADPIDALQSRIKATTDKTTLARLYKQLGDGYVAQNRFAEAADAFSLAFRTDREQFSADERVQMALYLSWADKLRESELELRAVLRREPNNTAARIHLARVLSWKGELSEAVEEADKVLKDAPENGEALLVKADALRWRDRIHEALPLYQKLIARDDDFNAWLGVSHSLLALGNRTAAIDTARSLKPTTFTQRREHAKLVDTIERETNPRVDGRYLYYRDSDDNRLNRYLLSYGLWIGNWNLDASFRHTDANDETRANRAEDLLFKIYSNFTDNIGAGIGLGLNQLGDGRTTTAPIGQVRVDARVWNGGIGFNLTREVLSDTAELIDNRIRLTSIGWSLSQALNDRLSVKPAYAYKHLSDGSRAHDIQFNTEYALYFDPKVTIAHRFRFLDYSRQSGSGLFDPDNYYSNRGVVSLYIQRPLYYAYLEAFLGQQDFRRNGVASSDLVKGGAASIGLTPIRHWTIEMYVEGGNFAAGSASGFNYFNLGPRVIYRF